MPSKKAKAKRLRVGIIQQLPLLVALVLLWMALWQSISWLSLVTGIVVAIAVTRMFYLPPVELSGRFNPFWLIVFLLRFAFDVVVASFDVAAQALRPRPLRHSAVIVVDLRTRSDFIMTLVAIATSLMPGSFVVEIDRDRSNLYLHSLGVHDAAGVEKARAKALSVERSIVHAVGSRDDWERLART